MLRTAGKMALKRGLEYSMSKTFRSDKNRLHLSEKGEELKDPLGGKVIRVTFGGFVFQAKEYLAALLYTK